MEPGLGDAVSQARVILVSSGGGLMEVPMLGHNAEGVDPNNAPMSMFQQQELCGVWR